MRPPLALFLAAGLACADTETLEMEVVFDPLSLNRPVEESPIGFDLGKNGEVVVQFPGNLYDVGGKKDLLAFEPKALSAFAFDGDRILFLDGGALRCLKDGKLSDLLEVPLHQVRMASGGGTTYLCGISEEEDASPALFAIRGEEHQRLLGLDALPDALAVGGDRVYFSVGPGIFSFRMGEPVQAVAVLHAFETVSSLAADPKEGLVYVSDGSATYVLHPPSARFALLLPDIGGELGFRDGRLYILTREKPVLLSIQGVTAASLEDESQFQEMKAGRKGERR